MNTAYCEGRTPALTHPPVDAGLQLRIFEAPPLRHLLHFNDNARFRPILECGEIAVVDPEHHWPEEGHLFLRMSQCREWSGGTYRRSYSIVETSRCHRRGLWMTHPFYRSPNYKAAVRAGERIRPGGFSDGPYRDDVTLADMLLGKVVGILQPTLIGASNGAH